MGLCGKFGMKTNNDKIQEWTLDNPRDDFMTGSIDTYTLKIKFKKRRYTGYVD